AETPTPAPEGGLKIGLVLSTGGLGDKNFNDMSYDGMLRAEKELGITFDYLDSASPSDFLPNLRMLSETGEYALIIGLGPDMGEAMTEITADFPDQKFSHVDTNLDLPGVSGVQTKWQEQTFLTGVLAGLGTLSDMPMANADNKVGVILGMDNPTLRLGVVGFAAGARYVNPDCEVLEGTVDSFNDPGKGKEIALAMYNKGADFIQSIAGASGLGIYNAAKEASSYAFGVGANVNYVEPDHIPATAMRKVDEMVYNEIKAVVDGTWTGGIHISGIKEDSVGYDPTQSNVVVPDDIQAAIEDIRQKIVSGDLVPPSSPEELDAWVAANQYSK
ncbi:MAG: BMP family ABC transporter substrate-binding protein, partial [Pseudoflavonifractor sp.]